MALRSGGFVRKQKKKLEYTWFTVSTFFFSSALHYEYKREAGESGYEGESWCSSFISLFYFFYIITRCASSNAGSSYNAVRANTSPQTCTRFSRQTRGTMWLVSCSAVCAHHAWSHVKLRELKLSFLKTKHKKNLNTNNDASSTWNSYWEMLNFSVEWDIMSTWAFTATTVHKISLL